MASERHSRLLLPVLLSAAFMIILDIFIVNVAAPSLRADLGATDGQVQWVIGAYLLAYAIALISGGRLGDVAGRRRVFRAGMLVFTISSILCAAAPNADALIAARVLQGLGAAAMWPQVLSVIQVEFAAAERPRPLAILGAVQGLASISGQILGGALVGLDLLGLGWRWVFAVNLPVGLAAIALAARAVPESRSDGARRLDLRGVAIGSLALALITVPIVEGRELGWPAWSFGALAAAAPVGWLFVRVERRVKARGGAPLLELRLFGERAFSLGLAAAFLVYSVPTYFLLVTLYLQDGGGLTALEAGLVFTPLAIAYAAASMLGPRLLARGGDTLAASGALVAGLGIAATIAVVLASGDRLAVAALIPAGTLVGLGMGLFVPPMIGLVLRAVPTADAGAASGMLSTTQQVGNALAVAIVGSVFFGVLGDRSTTAAFGEAFAAAAAIQVAAALTSALLVARIGARSARPEPGLAAPATVRESSG